MIPIHKFLSRLRWDRGFARGRIEIGYLDRVQQRIIRVPFQELRFPEDQHHIFEIVDAGGISRRIPFHRVREVRRDGRIIWRRPDLSRLRPYKQFPER
ncbi:MAG: DUF504 domain-containing protein [Opitutaceae bacterium]|nr:DUF504 domain-containing protein [Opitutaceae bacterium]